MTRRAGTQGREYREIDRLVKFVNSYGVGFVVYFGIGLVSALTEWAIFALALGVTSPIPAACIGFLVATLVNFGLSRRFAFVSRLGWLHELALVMLASGAVFVWNLAVFYILYRFLFVPIMIAKMTGTLVGFLLNYAVRQFWIFSRSSRYASAATLFDVAAQDRNQDRAITADD
jgi:putative flippase GtrA